MSLLLDTHVWLWWTAGDTERIPREVRRRILAVADERVFVSVASLWEITIKSALGKLTFPNSPASYAVRQMKRQRFHLLSIRPAHIDWLAEMPLHHRDPFDRMLIAQASAESLTVISADAALQPYSVDKVIF